MCHYYVSQRCHQMFSCMTVCVCARACVCICHSIMLLQFSVAGGFAYNVMR